MKAALVLIALALAGCQETPPSKQWGACYASPKSRIYHCQAICPSGKRITSKKLPFASEKLAQISGRMPCKRCCQ